MKLTKRLLAVLLSVAMLVGMVGIAAHATITDYDNYSYADNPYTAKYGIKLYKVDTSDDSITPITDGRVAPGDVIRVEMWLQTNYYSGTNTFLTAFDNNLFSATKNADNGYETYDYRTVNPATVSTSVFTIPEWTGDLPADTEINSFSNPWPYVTTAEAKNGFAGSKTLTALKGAVPTVWKNGNTINDYIVPEYMNFNFMKANATPGDTGALAGQVVIASTYQPAIYYNLTVKSDVPDGTTTKIWIPEESVKSLTNPSGLTASGRLVPNGSDVYGGDYQHTGRASGTLTNSKDTYPDDTNGYSRVYDITEGSVNLTITSSTEPPVSEVDKTALKTAIDAGAGTFTAANSTTASWTAYTTALAAANDVYADEEATQDEVNAAKTALTTAQGNLALRGECDYSALDAQIEAYEALTLTDYTPATVTSSDVTAKYNAATAVTRNMLADDDGANQDTIDAAATALDTAIKALTPKADKTDLKTAIDTLPAVTQANATPASWSEYAAKLEAANNVYADDNATQAAVDAAKNALNTARAAVASLGTCDYTALDAQIAAYDALTLTNYTPASVTSSDVTAKYNAAKAVTRNMLDTGSNQATITAAATALDTAIKALVEKADKTDLKAAIDALPTVAEDEATSASWTAYTTALATANSVYADDNATQDAVDAAKTELLAKTAAVAKLPVCDYDALNAAIQAYDDTNWDSKTPASITSSAVAAKYAAAKAITAGMLDDEDGANQQAITDAANALTAALALLKDRADNSALTAKIAEAAALSEDDYTPASWTTADLANVIAAAQVVEANANATADEIAAQITALENAIGALEDKADKGALKTAIDNAKAITSAGYTPASWTEADLANVIAAAQGVYDDGDASDADVAAAIKSINDAIAKLAPLANKDSLKAAIETLPEYTEDEATSSSWNDYQDALEEAQIVYDDPDATEDDIDTAETELRAAIAGVEFLGYVDVSDLHNKILEYEALDLSTKTPASIASSKVEEAYNAAKALDKDDLIDDEDYVNGAAVDDAWDALNNAMIQLKDKADKSALKTAIDTLPAVTEDEATSASWADYADALAEAEDVFADDNATQADVNNAASALDAARAAVQKLPLCDYSDLEDAIAAYEALDLSTKTPASVTSSKVTEMYNAAKAIATDLLDDEDGANQATIDEAYDNLNNAILALKDKADKTALQAAYDAEPSKTEDNATDATWSDYTAKLAAAKAVLDDDNATQDDVDAAKDALVAANAALANRDLCDYTALDAAKALTPEKAESEYTAPSWKAYKDALAEANAIAADLINNKAGTNQASITAAAAKLDAAYRALKLAGASIVYVDADFDEYYEQGTLPYELKVMGGASKVQIIDANGATMTFDRRSSKVSIVSYNAANEVVDYADEDPAYELWTLNLGLVEGVYQAKAKYGTVWDTETTEFTVTYATYEQTFTFVAAPKGDSEPADKTLDMTAAGTVAWSIVTPKDVTKVQLCFANGATSTYSASTKAVEGPNNTLVWTIERGVTPGDAGDVTLKTKVGYTWSVADTDPIVLTFAS